MAGLHPQVLATETESVTPRPSAPASARTSGRGHATPSRRRLGDVLVESGLLPEDQLEDALGQRLAAAFAGRRIRLGRLLIESGVISERDVARAMGELLNLEMV